jgi:hypothetical protein
MLERFHDSEELKIINFIIFSRYIQFTRLKKLLSTSKIISE